MKQPTAPEQVLAQPLHAGDTIGIVTTGAPDPASNPEAFDRGVARLQDLGFTIRLAEHARTKEGYAAGSEGDLVRDLLGMFEDPEISAIFCSGGGLTANRLLRNLDTETIARNPKIFLGASNPTILLNAIAARTGLVTFHGPATVWDWGAEGDVPQWTVDHFMQVMSGTPSAASLTGSSLSALKPGSAEGLLYGGSLSSLRALLGTPWEPPWDDAILIWEDVAKGTDYLDTVLTHFRDHGVLDRISGMIIGELASCEPAGGRDLEDLVEDLLGEYSFPVVSGLSFGHTPLKHTLPLGTNISITSDGPTISISGKWLADD